MTMWPRRGGARYRGKGFGVTFLRENVNYVGEGCLTWPMSRNPNGYAQFSVEGKQHWAHRFMCELVNGPPPTPEHEAAHSCGRGKFGCVDPRHLTWKTNAENSLDSREHGTQNRNPYGPKGRLTPQDVIQIRALRGVKTQAEIAAQFNISQPTIRDIFLGRSWREDQKKKPWRPDDDAILIGGLRERASLDVIASRMGRTYASVRARTFVLKRKSQLGQ